jgi:integrase
MTNRRHFGSVRKLPSGRYQASYWHEGARHVAPDTFTAKADALAYLSSIETGIRRGGWIDPADSKELFVSYANRWLLQRHDLRPRTSEDYETLLRVHLVPAFGDTQLGRMSPRAVREWYTTLSGQVPGRAHKAYRLLRAILNTAVADERLVRNPCQVKGAGQDRSAERMIPTVAEVETLVQAMPDRLGLLVLLAAWCGFRRGELLALRRCDVDLMHGSIRIERTVHQLRDGSLVLGPPKTDAGRRTVHYPLTLADAVTSHLSAFVASEPESLLFTGEKGGPLRPHVLQAAWECARRSAGVTYRLHDLRHLGATLAAGTGATTKEIMRRLGHQSAAAALVYQHASENRDEAIAAALSELALKAPVFPMRQHQI